MGGSKGEELLFLIEKHETQLPCWVLEGTTLMIRPTNLVRQGWEEKFKSMAVVGDDVLLDEELISPSSWDAEEWEW